MSLFESRRSKKQEKVSLESLTVSEVWSKPLSANLVRDSRQSQSLEARCYCLKVEEYPDLVLETLAFVSKGYTVNVKIVRVDFNIVDARVIN